MKINVYAIGAIVRAADTANVVRLFDAIHERKPEATSGETGVDERYAAAARKVEPMTING